MQLQMIPLEERLLADLAHEAPLRARPLRMPLLVLLEAVLRAERLRAVLAHVVPLLRRRVRILTEVDGVGLALVVVQTRRDVAEVVHQRRVACVQFYMDCQGFWRVEERPALQTWDHARRGLGSVAVGFAVLEEVGFTAEHLPAVKTGGFLRRVAPEISYKKTVAVAEIKRPTEKYF